MYTDIPNGNSAAQLASDAGDRPRVKGALSRARKAKPRDCFVDGCFGKPILGTPSPLPCPFCGSVAWVSIGGPGGEGGYNGDCSNCGAEGPVAATELEAALLWNRRPGEGTPRSSREQPLSRSARRTLRQLAAMRSYHVTVTGHAADRRAALVKAVREISGDMDLTRAKELLRAPWGFCYVCNTAEEADALQRKLVAAGAVCTVKYVDGNPVGEGGASEAA